MSVLGMGRSRLSWWAVGLALGAALSYVVYSFVGTFVFGLFLYYSTRPIYRRIKTRIRPPSLAAAVSLFLLALPALALVSYTGAIAVSELIRLTNEGLFDLSQYPISAEQLARLTDVEQALEFELDAITVPRIQQLFSSIGSAGNVVAFLGIGLVHLFAMIALAFYLLRDDRKLSRWARARVADDKGVLEAFLGAVDRDLTKIFFGNILNAVLTGTIGVIAYTLLNIIAPPGVAIPAAALVGLLAGVASLVPVVGMKLVYVPVTLYLAATSYLADPTTLWFTAVFAAVSFVVVDTIPDLVLRPYISGRNLHVGAVMIAYTLGPLLFGWYGIFLGPIILVLVVNFARHVLPVLIARESLVPYAVDPGVDSAVDPIGVSPADSEVAVDEPVPGPEDGETASNRDERSATEGRSPSGGTETDGGTQREAAASGFEFGVDLSERS
ncbi:AI-2E family transporter [Halobellus limi]|uniref:AI-2E family transporter n=1 Tax=Halobellus limi TaxID=699433 RepID=A0A1H6ALQ6_9EURY|nr:AI-2E family transporter [Halobellus limi]QCC47629.1 AI-2E family transporter [Halobellus limi]SEG48965.1 Predicted PurR-regulated permease PerM [Halobellus limi]